MVVRGNQEQKQPDKDRKPNGNILAKKCACYSDQQQGPDGSRGVPGLYKKQGRTDGEYLGFVTCLGWRDGGQVRTRISNGHTRLDLTLERLTAFTAKLCRVRVFGSASIAKHRPLLYARKQLAWHQGHRPKKNAVDT